MNRIRCTRTIHNADQYHIVGISSIRHTPPEEICAFPLPEILPTALPAVADRWNSVGQTMRCSPHHEHISRVLSENTHWNYHINLYAALFASLIVYPVLQTQALAPRVSQRAVAKQMQSASYAQQVDTVFTNVSQIFKTPSLISCPLETANFSRERDREQAGALRTLAPTRDKHHSG